MKILKNKKAGYGLLFENWAELAALGFLLMGFVIAAIVSNPIISYMIIFFCGFVNGRIWYIHRNDLRFPLFLSTVAFIIGFLVGNIFRTASTPIIIGMYLVGIIISYFVHKEGYILY